MLVEVDKMYEFQKVCNEGESYLSGGIQRNTKQFLEVGLYTFLLSF